MSKPELEFLDHLGIPDTKENRQIRINRYHIDGYDEKTNTIYEFLGDYFHGNPNNKKFNSLDYNKTCHKTFGELYENTFKKLNKLKELGYNVKYVWEWDWKKFKKGIDKQLNIIDVI